MNARGQQGMGFSQTATTQHFLLESDGGAIQVEANDPADAASLGQIRMHLAHIAKQFANGDFEIPMFVHDTIPPGVSEMKRLRDKIAYKFEETPAGARVEITTAEPQALAAVWQFLWFQIANTKPATPQQHTSVSGQKTFCGRIEAFGNSRNIDLRRSPRFSKPVLRKNLIGVMPPPFQADIHGAAR